MIPTINPGVASRTIDLRLLGTTERREMQTRAMQAGAFTAGGALVPDSMLQGAEVGLVTSPIRQLADVRRPARGAADFSIPTLDAGGEGDILAEGAEIAEWDASWTATALAPVMYTSGKVVCSNHLLDGDAPQFAPLIMKALARRVARRQNRTLTHDLLHSGTRIVVPAASSSAIADAELVDLYHAIDQTYRARAVWMGTDATFKAIRKLKGAGSGNFILDPHTTTIMGRPCVSNEHFPEIATGERVLLFGDLSALVVVDTMMRLARNSESRGEWNQSVISLLLASDGGLTDPDSVVVLQMA